MTTEEWDYINRRLLQEGMDERTQRQEAARSIWRQERYIRKNLE
ncbi:MAG TPA: hypothetical protein VHU84_09840 [Lacipirellulaceae bacterium]|nr:hypothetical protein [Lacipirellulaceae bacterium]